MAAVEHALGDGFQLMGEKYQEWQQIRAGLGLISRQEEKDAEIREVQALYDMKIINEEQLQEALKAIRGKYRDDELGDWKNAIGSVAGIFGNFHSTVSDMEDMALKKSKVRKDRELAAAGDNAEARAAIEEKYTKEEFEIQKKYADANFAMQAAQITASTALAAINAYAAVANIPVAGPALAAIAAAAAVAAGLIQLAQAKQARDQAKSVSLSGSLSGGSKITFAGSYQTGGHTGSGDPAGIVHRGEYVIPNVVMRNPAAVDHVRVLEAMRQSYYPGIRRSPGFLEGGYAAGTGKDSPAESVIQPDGNNQESCAIRELIDMLAILAPAVERLNREGAKISYERLKDSEKAAGDVIYRATRRNS